MHQLVVDKLLDSACYWWGMFSLYPTCLIFFHSFLLLLLLFVWFCFFEHCSKKQKSKKSRDREEKEMKKHMSCTQITQFGKMSILHVKMFLFLQAGTKDIQISVPSTEAHDNHNLHMCVPLFLAWKIRVFVKISVRLFHQPSWHAKTVKFHEIWKHYYGIQTLQGLLIKLYLFINF